MRFSEKNELRREVSGLKIEITDLKAKLAAAEAKVKELEAKLAKGNAVCDSSAQGKLETHDCRKLRGHSGKHCCEMDGATWED